MLSILLLPLMNNIVLSAIQHVILSLLQMIWRLKVEEKVTLLHYTAFLNVSLDCHQWYFTDTMSFQTLCGHSQCCSKSLRLGTQTQIVSKIGGVTFTYSPVLGCRSTVLHSEYFGKMVFHAWCCRWNIHSFFFLSLC